MDEIIGGKKSRGADGKIGGEISGMISKIKEKNCVKVD